jgi:hypothetical protein
MTATDTLRIRREMDCARCIRTVFIETRVPMVATMEEIDEMWAETLLRNGWRQRPKGRFSKKLRWYCETHA